MAVLSAPFPDLASLMRPVPPGKLKRLALRAQLEQRQCMAPVESGTAQCPLQASRLLRDKATGVLRGTLCTVHHQEWLAAGKTAPESWKPKKEPT